MYALRLSKRDTADLLRSVGGLLFAVGAMALLVRKSDHHEWSSLARLLVVLVPAALLYALALRRPEPSGSADARPWQSVLAVTAILLVPVALFQFLEWLGASTRHSLYDAAVFAVTALLAGYAARRTRVSYAAFLAGVASLLVWLFVWGQILHHPSADTVRWLTVAAGALLLAVAAGLARTHTTGASEVATAGGLAAVAAGVFGVIVGTLLGLVRAVSEGSSSSGVEVSRVRNVAGSTRGPSQIYSTHYVRSSPSGLHAAGLQHFGWDAYLLIVSLALVWVGSRVRARGLGYVGTFGLLAFVLSVGLQITRLQTGKAPNGDIVGWPLALLLVGTVGLVAAALYDREPSRDESA